MGTVHSDWAPMLAILPLLLWWSVTCRHHANQYQAYARLLHRIAHGLYPVGVYGRRRRFYRRPVLRHLPMLLMAAVSFGVLMVLSTKDIECENIKDLAGLLNQRHAWFAFLMLLSMFSMAGIPPLMGFTPNSA